MTAVYSSSTTDLLLDLLITGFVRRGKWPDMDWLPPVQIKHSQALMRWIRNSESFAPAAPVLQHNLKNAVPLLYHQAQPDPANGMCKSLGCTLVTNLHASFSGLVFPKYHANSMTPPPLRREEDKKQIPSRRLPRDIFGLIS